VFTPATGALRQAKVLWVREGFAKITCFGAFRDRGARGIQGEQVSDVLELLRLGVDPAAGGLEEGVAYLLWSGRGARLPSGGRAAPLPRSGS